MIFLRNVVAGLLFVVTVTVFLVPLPVLGQVDLGYDRGEDAAAQGGLRMTRDIKQIVVEIINFVLGFMGIIAVLALIIAGITYMTSLGDEKKAETAKRTILYVVFGLILILLSAAIVNLVLKTVVK